MPSLQKVHLDKALTEISIGYKNEQYIADKVFLPVSVTKQSDRYYVFGKEAFRQHDDARAPGTEANEINWSLSLDTYFCEGHALRTPIPDEEIQNADDIFNLEADASELVTEGILLNKEISAADTLLDSANYDSELVFTLGGGGTNPVKWSDFDNSDPIMDIAKAKEKIHRKSGLRPNTLVISETVYNVLRIHPKVTKLFSGIAAVSLATYDQIKMALGVESIVIGSALKSSATNVGQTDNLNYIWGNSAVLCFVPARPGKKTQSIGYSFMWDKDSNGPVQVRSWYEQGRRSTVVEAERWYSQKMISNVAGFLFSDAVDPIGA